MPCDSVCVYVFVYVCSVALALRVQARTVLVPFQATEAHVCTEALQAVEKEFREDFRIQDILTSQNTGGGEGDP